MRQRRGAFIIAFLIVGWVVGPVGGTGAQEPGSDLSVSKIGDPDPVSAGGTVQYVVSVTNRGPGASGARVRDTVTDGTILSFGGSGWTCSQPSALAVECLTNARIAAGATAAPIEVLVRVPDEAGSVQNRARVSGDGEDPDLSNNEATAKTTVREASGDEFITFCPPGGCTFDTGDQPTEDDTTVNRVEVPAGGNGSKTRIAEGLTTFPCGDDTTFGHETRGQETDFVPPTGLVDQNNPIRVTTTWHVSVWPLSDTKVRICMRKEQPAPRGQIRTVLFSVQPCRTPGVASPSPCVDGSFRDAEGNMSVRMLMLSPDPQWRR